MTDGDHPMRLTQRRLRVRLADSSQDIAAAQRLRWSVFYDDLGACPPTNGDTGMSCTIGLDVDPYDAVCDHLLVEDMASGSANVVGTYRLLRQSIAATRSGFYSAGEYDLAPIINQPGELLELGRSCVASAYRDAGTIQLLWRGIASYLQRHGISMMFGCASFHGVNPDDHADSLSYLCHNHLAPSQWRVRALEDQRVDMARLPLGSYDREAASRRLPPLIKAYLRVGAMIGDGAVIDHQFNTVDVFIVMPTSAISQRYLGRFATAA